MFPRCRLLAASAIVSALGTSVGCAPSPASKGAAPSHPLLSSMAREAAGAGQGGAFAVSGPEASAVSFERMARFPEPGWQVPRAIGFSPDGKLVTYLQSEALGEEMALFAFDLETKQSRVLARAKDVVKDDRPLTREEELRRERQRQRIKGITAYGWAKRAPVLVVPLGGDVFVRAGEGGIVRLTDTAAAEIDPKLCDDGRRVAFVRGGELVMIDVATRKETVLTKGAPEGTTRGLSDYNAQEEFEEQSGFWWSPGCDRIAYLEVDERAVATTPVAGYREGRADLMMQRYPRTGERNPVVRALVLDVATRTSRPLALESGPERYLGRFAWSPDGRALFLQALARDQKRLTLLRADPATGKVTELATQTSPTWIELSPLVPLERSARLVWTNATSGHRHIELRDVAGSAPPSMLTSGDWDVLSIDGVDELAGRVLFTATKDGALEQHLYAVDLHGGEPVRLSSERGVHAAFVADEGRGFVDLHSASDRPPVAVVHGPGGEALGELPARRDADFDALAIRPAELVKVTAADGTTTLFGALLRPRKVEPGRRHPVVVMVYGGPGVQTVLDRWSARLLWQHLADRGFVVFQLDNRGSANRGAAFEGAIAGKLGEVELADQLAGLDYLATLPFVDVSRTAIYGHSYGGFLSALAMLRAPERFRAGIAASPVTDWRLYDSGYTERYMGAPRENPKGYDEADLAKHAGALRGRLFLVHALMDENVHFHNTARLVDALVAADKPFDLLVFPGERHGYRSPLARTYALRRVVDYLVDTIGK